MEEKISTNWVARDISSYGLRTSVEDADRNEFEDVKLQRMMRKAQQAYKDIDALVNYVSDNQNNGFDLQWLK